MSNFRLVRENRTIFVMMALIIGLISGLLIAGGLNINPTTKAEIKGNELEVENAFVKVAEKIGPAVVSISTEHIEHARREYYFGPFFGDEFFDDFFKEFFGGIPQKPYKRRGLGSGVIIDEEGYILTNEHVIENAEKITVTLPDGREFKGEIKGTDPRSDLAVIKIKANNLPVAELGDSDNVKIGQWAIAIGNPFGFAVRSPKPTLTVGVISALHRSLPRIGRRERDYTDLIQTDAAINPGNSGGPLVNLEGKVIGINVAIFTTSGGYQGVGFAIPIDAAKHIVGRLIEGKKILYGWLGVSIQEIDQDLADYFKLTDREGVLVVKVLEGSPAEKAGFKEGDIIRTFNGYKIKDVRELLKRVGRTEVGKRVKVGVIREGKEMTLVVKIGERPEEIEEFGKISIGKWRGIEVSELTAEVARRFNVEGLRGVIVSDVEVGSAGDMAGLKIGDVILEINRHPIKNLADYKKVTAQISGNALVRTQRGYLVIRSED
jgi:serine protease Do